MRAVPGPKLRRLPSAVFLRDFKNSISDLTMLPADLVAFFPEKIELVLEAVVAELLFDTRE
jgi:hypothetical protein